MQQPPQMTPQQAAAAAAQRAAHAVYAAHRPPHPHLHGPPPLGPQGPRTYAAMTGGQMQQRPPPPGWRPQGPPGFMPGE